MKQPSSCRALTVAVAAGVCLLAAPSGAQWQIDAKDGSASIRVGFLAQPQAEWLETADGESTAQNLYIRRFRILFGGKVSNKWTFFFETDSPNIGKANAQGVKEAPDIFIQDVVVTYDHSAAFKIDTGMLLLPLTHNHMQSAATLLPVDYGAFSFIESGPLGERIGRDYGVQLRGYPAKQKLEYRLGVVQGARGAEARNAFRVYGRAVYYPFAADTGFFYAGTYQGTRRMLALGGTVDRQKTYHLYSADVFYEQPFRDKSGGLTVQATFAHVDGEITLETLPRSDAVLVEAAVHLGGGRWSPFVQFASREFESTAQRDQHTFQAGVAWWMRGHNRNVKVGVGRQHMQGLPDRTQVQIQLQIFYY